jgi:hypothetical protein
MHRSGGHHQCVDAVKCAHRDGALPVDLTAVAHQPMRRDIARRADDAPHRRIQRGVRMRVDEFAYGGVSFADQRALVEQLGCGQERCNVHRDDSCARGGQPADGGVECGTPLPAQLGQFVRNRDDGTGRRREPDVGRPLTGPCAGGYHAHGEVRQLEVRCENRDTVIGFAGRHHAVGADHPDRGFDSDDALQARGHAPRARSVGADRDVGLAGGDRDRRSRAGSAADEFGPAAVGHRAVGRAGADQARRELVEVGLPDDDRARRPQRRHDGRVTVGPIRELRAGRGGGQPGGVDVVLHREPDTGQRALAPLELCRYLGIRPATDPHRHDDQPRARRSTVLNSSTGAAGSAGGGAAVSAPSRSMAVSPTSPGMHRARRSR